MKKADLGVLIRNFFERYLTSQRGLSENTVLAYRDTWKLFLHFACKDHSRSCDELMLQDLKADTVRRFLDHLERDRGNSTSTRNNRLAAIHSFFSFVIDTDPRYLSHGQTILGVRFKRGAHRVPEYLEREEVQAIFSQIDRATPLGLRDDAMLRLLYNTGMRAQELVDLNVNHLRFSRPSHVRIHGKGRKERTCPLWKETLHSIKMYLENRSVDLNEEAPLFVNTQGKRLTRFGLRHIVGHRVAEAAKVRSSLLVRRVTPHTWRHTTAMHLLQSNVDLSMIRSWLGHASIETTNNYVEFDLEMKRKTLQSCEKLLANKESPRKSWKRNPDLLSWLTKL